jgi:hypothetical protein
LSRKLLNPALLALAFALVLVPVCIRLLLWGFSLSGFLSDLLVGLTLSLLLYRRHPLWAAVGFAVWGGAMIGAIELVDAVGRMPEPSDIQYLLDPSFISHSTGGSGLTHPFIVSAILVTSLLSILVLLRLHGRHLHPALHRVTWLIPVLLLALHASAMKHDENGEPWKQYSVVHKIAAEKILNTLNSRENRAAQLWAISRRDQQFGSADISGQSLLTDARGKARNVLVITLEGIPGAYINQVREARGYQWDQQPMPALSAYALQQRAMHTADFVIHTHQTIRGLYAMLCADYPKLDSSTPKAMEMLSAANSRQHYCLPAQLASHGFATHFLQATDLTFMSKDRFMPLIGFQTVCGDSCLGKKHSFAWGLDDKDFFEGSLAYIKKLRSDKSRPWMLTLLTVGTHQPYGAPASYLKRHQDPKMAAVAYLDDAITQFLRSLQKQGVLDDTLVIVTSDESHGIDDLRLSSAWGLNLIFAPEREQLPLFKQGVYGQVDLTASVLDYFGLQPQGVMGRSLFRNYPQGRDMLSYTNGLLRYLAAEGGLLECQFQTGCKQYPQQGFIAPLPEQTAAVPQSAASRVQALAGMLDESMSLSAEEQEFIFAQDDKRKLKKTVENDWTDNLIGAQYLQFAPGTRTHVTLRIKASKTDRKGAQLLLRLKEFDQDSDATAPELPLLRKGETIAIDFNIDNPAGRKAFSFHLLGTGNGEIQIEEFRVSVRKLPAGPATDNAGQVAEILYDATSETAADAS